MMITEKNPRGGWYYCPRCGKRLFPVYKGTVVRKLPYKCRSCRRSIEVNIPEPGAKAP